MKKLAILIPTTPDRKPVLDRLLAELLKQRHENNAEQFVYFKVNNDNREKTTGFKRNELLQWAIENDIYAIAYHDSDDMPGGTYIKRGIEFMESGMDCAELLGQIYFSGKKGMPFHHYLGCTHAWQDDKQYHRPANHLNFMRLDRIKNFKFEDKSFGEDMCFAMEIQNAGVFKTMFEIPETIYHYFVGEPKHEL